MKPLNKRWIKRYHEQEKGYPYGTYTYHGKDLWVGAWRLMRDCQNTEVTGD